MSTQAQRRAKRRKVLPGFPKDIIFTSIEEAKEYLDGDKIQCLLCGKWYRSLGYHINKIHEINEEGYKERFGIPWTYGLVGAETKEKHKVLGIARAASPGAAETLAEGRKKCPISIKRSTSKAIQKQRSVRLSEFNNKIQNTFCMCCGAPVSKMGSYAKIGRIRCDSCLEADNKMGQEGQEKIRQWEVENLQRSIEYKKARIWWWRQKNPQPLLNYASKWGAKLRSLPKLLAAKENTK